MSRIADLAFISACLVAVMLGTTQLWERIPSQKSPSHPPGVESVAVRLATDRWDVRSGGLAFVEFSDFECPFCREFARDVYPALRERYFDTGAVHYRLQNFPLERIHPGARRRALAFECARGQGRGEGAYRVLFGGEAVVANYRDAIREVVVSPTRFEQCASADGNSSPESLQIDRQIASAKAAGVESTPTFFIGRIENSVFVSEFRVKGAQPLEVFVDLLDSARKR